ncbi:hypothetical protein P5673_014992 [Acropora cervicornis]|uniref:Uncharacterized protein n=1 Tax=Acropora cervicornis TaxID=6130 RepID=A0AAD9QJ58_ACRCE|nr:hypothetical protein P5673_014992 [Acropora cervicornis]
MTKIQVRESASFSCSPYFLRALQEYHIRRPYWLLLIYAFTHAHSICSNKLLPSSMAPVSEQ